MAYKVLIVDDEQRIADTLAVIFAENGYEARAAYDPRQAPEIIVEWLPDLIILDIILIRTSLTRTSPTRTSLTRTSGIDLAIFIKERFPACRLLLFSGQPATADLLAEAATKGHTFEILAKPIHPTQMLAAALRLLTNDTVN